jgi:hypothetical protein
MMRFDARVIEELTGRACQRDGAFGGDADLLEVERYNFIFAPEVEDGWLPCVAPAGFSL